MKKMKFFCFLVFCCLLVVPGLNAQNSEDSRKAKSDADQESKAKEWVSELNLNSEENIQAVEKVISNHLKAVRDWHNEHPHTLVPAGINPKTGELLSELDRRMIAHSAKPDSIHENFMSGLRQYLNQDQVIRILDTYTVGKVDFTMKGYHAIVPDLTEKEAKHIRGLLEEARERAVDYKNMEEISAIFEIYKTKAENYLNSNGRSWRQLYKDFVNRDK